MIKRLLTSSFAKFTSIVFVGNLLAQVILFIAFALFSRLFEMYDIGVYTVFISVSILLAIPSTARYELAIMLPKKDKEGATLLSSALLISSIFCALFFLILFLIPVENIFEKLQKIQHLILLIPLGVFLMAAFQSFIIYFNRIKEFKINALVKFIQASTMLGFSLLLYYTYINDTSALVYGWLISQAIVFFVYVLFFQFKGYSSTWKEKKVIMNTYIRYPTISLVSNFINSLSIELPNYLIPYFFGAATQTLYAYGNKVAAMPRNFIAGAIGEVFYKSGSAIASDNPKELLKHLTKITKILFAFSTTIYIIGILTSKFLFPIVFDANYIEAVPYFNWIAAASIFMFVQSPISAISDIVARLQPPLIFNIISLTVKAAVLTFAGIILKDAIQMIALYGIVSALLSFGWIAYLFKMAKNFSEKPATNE